MSSKAFFDAQRLHMKGDILSALRIYDGLLKKNEDDGRARLYKGLALVQLGRSAEAFAEVQKALGKISRPEAGDLSTAGIVFRQVGQFSRAEDVFQKAHRLAPGNGGIISNLGLVKMMVGKLDEALIKFEEAHKLLPEEAAPLLNMARIKLRQKDFEGVEQALRIADDIDPGHHELNMLRAELSLTEADEEKAFVYVIKSLKVNPVYFEGWKLINRLDISAVNLKALEEVAAAFVVAKPTSGRLLSTVAGVLRRNLAWNSLPRIEAQLDEALIHGKDNVIETSATFMLLACNVSQEAHKIASCAAWRLLSYRQKDLIRPVAVPLSQRKLRVGILSSDLRNHAIGYLVVGVLEAHNKEKIELVAYTNFPDDGGTIRQRMRSVFDKFVNVQKLSGEQIAEKIKSDRIDILVDLNGLTAETMIGVMPYKPAPVTVNWLGMPGTNGGGQDIDYIILDRVVCDEVNIKGFDEKVVLLPHSYQPNDHRLPEQFANIQRSKYGLPEDAFVYCSFNQAYKFSPDTIALWSEILRKNDRGVLWIFAPGTELQARIKHVFSECGIDPQKIIFAGKVSHDEHIARIGLADLMLDNWPYNAHTTCSDALRAGTPIVTLPGPTFASRVAASILSASHLGEWIAKTEKDYVSIAVALGSKGNKQLLEIKKQIRSKYIAGAMTDCARFAKNLETFYFSAYERALQGSGPVDFEFNSADEITLLDTSKLRSVHADGNSAQLLSSNPIEQDPEVDANIDIHASDQESLKEAQDTRSDVVKNEVLDRNHSLNNLQLLQSHVLKMNEIPLVVDVGAAEFNAQIGYERLVERGLARVLGFEPDPDSFEKLQQTTLKRYSPDALGDGKEHELSLCTSPGMNSLLEPDQMWLAAFPMFSVWGTVQRKLPISTKRLDDVEEARNARFLKMDVRGAEMLILQHGERVLENLSLLQIEASPTPLYHKEASLFEIGLWLQERGFILHTLSDINKRCFKPFGTDESPFTKRNQIFQVDAVFMPHPHKWNELDDERLNALAFFAHAIYYSYDVAMLAMDVLDKRDQGSRVDAYRLYLTQAGLAA